MIRVTKVTKTFERFRALDELNIRVPQGAVYGLVGPNGAGKTTIIRHITGVYRPDSGSVEVAGQPVYENNEVKSRIFYIPDDFYYFAQANTRDMMEFYRHIYPSFDVQRYEKLKAVFEIDEKRSIRRLSRGMQKQVAFWLALSARPEVLILDEPVDGIDPVKRRQVWQLVLGETAANGMTVLVSSHNLRELEDVCDHVGIMNGGKMLLEHSLSELQANIVKLQVAFSQKPEQWPQEFNILHESQSGRLTTLIVRGEAEAIARRVEALQPLFFDLLPLTLEEIFIYELGGDRDVSGLLL